MGKNLISIVIPCFNEEEVLETTIERLFSVIDHNPDYDFEVILVDDGSEDTTREILSKMRLKDSRVKLVFFTRNFGHQIAVSAGLNYSSGDSVIVLDADLQDPPELIPTFLSYWVQGYDIVYGVRKSRSGESAFKKVSAWGFYRLLNNLSDVRIPHDTGDFRLISKRVVDKMNQLPERARYLRGLMSWTGYPAIGVPYSRDARFAGKTKYSLRKMLSLATQSVLSFSTKPLELMVFVGSAISALSLGASLWFAISRFVYGLPVPGWTALIVAITFLGGIQILATGIVGSYVGRIFNEVRGRPLYYVESALGFSEGQK